MTENQATFQGKCLCGAVSISFQHEKPTLSACHCSMSVPGRAGHSCQLKVIRRLLLDGAEHVRSYPSSEWAERCFCSLCGTHLFYRLRNGGFHALAAGLFKDGATWPFKLQVYIDEKPENYQFANRTREMTGEEVVKLFS